MGTKKGSGHEWECPIPSEVIEGRVARPEEIATWGHVSQDLPHIHVSGQVGDREEPIRFLHSPLNCLHYLQAAVVLPFPFIDDARHH